MPAPTDTEPQSIFRMVPMELGINLPWCSYGADLGAALTLCDKTPVTSYLERYDKPPPTPQVDKVPVRNRLHHQLAVIKRLGIIKVRWILLGDAWNVGPAPKIESDRWTWDVMNLQVPKGYRQDFENILKVFVQMDMQLVPSFANGGLLEPGRIQMKWVGGKDGIELKPDPGATSVAQAVQRYLDARGLKLEPRATVCFDNFIKGGKLDVIKNVDTITKFYNELLDPLLAVSKDPRYRKAIPVWEIFSEPDLIYDTWAQKDSKGRKDTYWGTVDKTMLQTFLAMGMQRIYDAGFTPSIGFQRPGNMEEYLRSPLIANCIAKNGGAFERNFHFYPETNEKDTVATLVRGAVVGEFATKVESWQAFANFASWPEDVARRLKILSDSGIAVAYPWSAFDDSTSPLWARFSAANQAAMKAFIDSGQMP